MCWGAVKNVQMPVMWKGKPQSLCAEAAEPTQRTEPAVEGSGVPGPWTPRTWPLAWYPSCLQEGQSKR